MNILLGGSPSVSPTNTGDQNLYGLLIFIAIIVSLRLYRGINGSRYGIARVLRAPVLCLLITTVSIFLSVSINSELLFTLLLLPAFTLVGYRIGTNVAFFDRNGALYYKRSPLIMVIWLVAFIARFGIEILIPLNLTILLAIDILLCSTTGLLFGEALNVIKKKNEYAAGKKEGEPLLS